MGIYDVMDVDLPAIAMYSAIGLVVLLVIISLYVLVKDQTYTGYQHLSDHSDAIIDSKPTLWEIIIYTLSILAILLDASTFTLSVIKELNLLLICNYGSLLMSSVLHK